MDGLLLIRKGRDFNEPITFVIANVEVVFRPTVLEDGTVVMAGIVTDADAAIRVRAQVRRMPAYEVVTDPNYLPNVDADVFAHTVAGAAGPGPLTGEAAEAHLFSEFTAITRRRALINGWDGEDIAGTGSPTPGPEGGTNARSGLFLAQMAVCTPPRNWAALSATVYPWECADWTPPLDFHPPTVPSKKKTEEAPPAPVEPTPEPPKKAVEPAAEDTATTGAAAATTSAALAAYSEDPAVVAAAREVLARLAEEAEGTLPSRSKANYWFSRNKPKLPNTSSDDVYAALIAPLLPPTT